jgi:phosphate transport system substrate-binding protein
MVPLPLRIPPFALGTLASLLAGCTAMQTPASVPELSGAVSTFSSQAFFRWFNQLAVHHNLNSELEVVGSGESIRAFLAGTVDFAATDTAPTKEELRSARRGLVAFPVTAGAIAVAYNLPGCELRLSRQQLVQVFLGEFTNFAQLGCANQPITVLHRSTASGTTANFTASLAAFSPAWRQGPGVGRRVRWPVGRGVVGSEGMATALAETTGAIGYVEAAYVRDPLQAAALQNQSGQWVRPDAAATAQALASIELDQHFLGSNPDPAEGYPIVNFSWMLVPARGLGPRIAPLKTSLTFILSQAGQDDAERLGYVPLPAPLRQRALQQFTKLRSQQGGGA